MHNKLQIVPLTLREANQLVIRYHRHNKPVQGAKFAIGVCDQDGLLHGAAIVGRPVARLLDDGWSVEVTRVVTDGTPNACSMLYGAARRIAFAQGYRKILTYTLQRESGSSLKAAGWRCMTSVPACAATGWCNRAGRHAQQILTEEKFRWEAVNGTIVSPSFSTIRFPEQKEDDDEHSLEYLL